MNDFGKSTQGAIGDIKPFDQHFERTSVPFMRELGIEHIEAQFTRFGSITFRRYELESILSVDEPADQPRGSNTIHVHSRACHPCSSRIRTIRLLYLSYRRLADNSLEF